MLSNVKLRAPSTIFDEVKKSINTFIFMHKSIIAKNTHHVTFVLNDYISRFEYERMQSNGIATLEKVQSLGGAICEKYPTESIAHLKFNETQ